MPSTINIDTDAKKSHTSNGLGQKRTREEEAEASSTRLSMETVAQPNLNPPPADSAAGRREAAFDAVIQILSNRPSHANPEYFAEFRKLLLEALDVNAEERGGGSTILHCAAMGDLPDHLHLKALAAGEAVTGEVGESGTTAFIEVLIAAGANVNARDDFGTTVLRVAAEFGSADAANALIAAGANVHEGDYDGWTPLHFAVKKSHAKLVEILIAAGSDLNHRDNYGDTPLNKAIEAGRMDVIRALIDGGADVNFPNGPHDVNDLTLYTPLMVASWYNLPEVAEALIAAGADVHQIGGEENALDVAFVLCHAEVVALLKASRAVLHDAVRYGLR